MVLPKCINLLKLFKNAKLSKDGHSFQVWPCLNPEINIKSPFFSSNVHKLSSLLSSSETLVFLISFVLRRDWKKCFMLSVLCIVYRSSPGFLLCGTHESHCILSVITFQLPVYLIFLCFLRYDLHNQFIFLEEHFSRFLFLKLAFNMNPHMFFPIQIRDLHWNVLRMLLWRKCGGKRLVNIKYPNLDSFKGEVILFCHCILETKGISNIYSLGSLYSFSSQYPYLKCR